LFSQTQHYYTQVPLLSALGSLATLGLLDVAVLEENDLLEEEDEDENDVMNDEGGGGGGGTTRFLQIAGRRLSIGSTSLTVVKVIVIVIGAILAVCIHLMKMIIRLFGEGCCTGCITMVEVTFVMTTVLISIYIQQVAIVIAVGLLCVAGYILKRKCIDKKQPDGAPPAAAAAAASGATTTTTPGYGATTTTANNHPGNVTTTVTTTTAPDGSIITTTYITTTTAAPPTTATAAATANPDLLLPVADIEQPATIATLVMEIPASIPQQQQQQQQQQHPPPSAPIESPQK
jgi:hypothetical protein